MKRHAFLMISFKLKPVYKFFDNSTLLVRFHCLLVRSTLLLYVRSRVDATLMGQLVLKFMRHL